MPPLPRAPRHDDECENIANGGGAEPYHATKKYDEAVVDAVQGSGRTLQYTSDRFIRDATEVAQDLDRVAVAYCPHNRSDSTLGASGNAP